MNIRDEVRRLIDRVRELEDRVGEIETEGDDGGGEDRIGFEIDDPEEFDEDASEY